MPVYHGPIQLRTHGRNPYSWNIRYNFNFVVSYISASIPEFSLIIMKRDQQSFKRREGLGVASNLVLECPNSPFRVLPYPQIFNFFTDYNATNFSTRTSAMCLLFVTTHRAGISFIWFRGIRGEYWILNFCTSLHTISLLLTYSFYQEDGVKIWALDFTIYTTPMSYMHNTCGLWIKKWFKQVWISYFHLADMFFFRQS